jgi:RNA polymerase sigma factor (sigma-70 family)
MKVSEEQAEKDLKAQAESLGERLPRRIKTALKTSITDYRKIIYCMASRYVRTRVEYEDLIQEAFVGLILADRDFDEKRSEDFRTYAITRIRGRMYEYGIRNDTLITVPTHVAKAVSYVRQIDRLLDRELGLELDNTLKQEILQKRKHKSERRFSESVRERLDFLKQRLENIAKNSKMTYETLAGLAIESLALVVSDEALNAHIGEEENIDTVVGSKELAERLKGCLDERQYLVIVFRSAGFTYREIAQKLFDHGFGNSNNKPVSRQAVKAILETAKKAIVQAEVLKTTAEDL